MTCNQRLDVHPTFLLGKNATASNSGCLEASCYKWGRGRPLDAWRERVPQATLRWS
jgi:hypothetical protein